MGSNSFGSTTGRSPDGTVERINTGAAYPCATAEEQSTLQLSVEKRDSDYSTHEFEERKQHKNRAQSTYEASSDTKEEKMIDSQD